MPEKPTITKIHLLVHPFYGVNYKYNIWLYRFDKPEFDPKRFEKTLSRQWGNLIRRIKDNPCEVLVFVPSARHKRANKLRDFAKNELGERVIEIFYLDDADVEKAIKKIERIGKIDRSKVEIEGHGEISGHCVNSCILKFATVLGDPELIKEAKEYRSAEMAYQRVKGRRVLINPQTTETLAGKERFIKRHNWRKPTARKRINTFRKRRNRKMPK